MSNLYSYSEAVDPALANAELAGRCFESVLFYSDVFEDDKNSALEGIGEKAKSIMETIKTIFAHIWEALKRFADRIVHHGGATMCKMAWHYGKEQCKSIMNKLNILAQNVAKNFESENYSTESYENNHAELDQKIDSTISEIKNTMETVKNKVKNLAITDRENSTYEVDGLYTQTFSHSIKIMEAVIHEICKYSLPTSDKGSAINNYYYRKAVQLTNLSTEATNFFGTISFICRKESKNITSDNA